MPTEERYHLADQLRRSVKAIPRLGLSGELKDDKLTTKLAAGFPNLITNNQSQFLNMQYLEDSLKDKMLSIWRSFRAEIILISISFFILVVSLAVFVSVEGEKSKILFEEKLDAQITNNQSPTSEKIYIDLAGAVEEPDVYQVTSGARLKDVLVLANGLSAEADRVFFARNFNLARILQDQEKIYIPSKNEVEEGIVKSASAVKGESAQNSSSKININTASEAELDTLPGVGEATAQKIIENRPYLSIEELLEKKAVNKGQWEEIKELVTID